MTDEHDERARDILTAWDIHMDSSEQVSLDTYPGGRGIVLRIPCGRWSAEWIERGRAFLASELRAAEKRGRARGEKVGTNYGLSLAADAADGWDSGCMIANEIRAMKGDI